MRILHSGVLLASAATLLLSAGCGSSGGGTASAAPSGSASASGGFAAYAACLRQHGVNIPTARPAARPSGRPSGGGLFGGGANRQALQACGSPARRRGGGFGARGMQELQAFRSCLSDHGVTLPTPSPGMRPPDARRSPGARRTPGGGGFPGRFDTSDPKVTKALRTCHPLLPTFSPRPRPTGS